jgi:hypothetical protein
MKMIVKSTVLGVFAAFCLQPLCSQNKVSYGYDSAGNRVSRTIDYPQKSSAAPSEEQPAAVYSEALSDIELKIYPNPTDGLLKVEIHNLPENTKAQIWLYSISGALIRTYKGVSDYVNIDISKQPSGIYLMKITAGNYQTEWKIIKK